MPKVSRCGQAEILSDTDYARVFKQISNPTHRLFLNIARYTGERVGAIIQLQVSDVYLDPTRSLPSNTITFPSATRKASPTGKRQTRQVPVHPLLTAALLAYHPPSAGWLFPSSQRSGNHVCFKAVDKWFRSAVDKAGLSKRGISLHSPRRTLITGLDTLGVSLSTIQAITGHKSVEVLRRYVHDDPKRIRNAIALL